MRPVVIDGVRFLGIRLRSGLVWRHPRQEPIGERKAAEATAINNSDLRLVGARGFEPPTSRSQTERTTRLCYAPSRSIVAVMFAEVDQPF